MTGMMAMEKSSGLGLTVQPSNSDALADETIGCMLG